jgi:hypothetical protein
MFTATTFIVVSISLAVLLYFGSKEHHQVREGTEIYRYQSVLIRVIFIGIPGSVLASGFVYSTFPPGEPRGIGLFIFVAIFSSFSLIFIVIYLYSKKFYIEIDDQYLRIGGLWPERKIPFSDIRKIELTQGLRGSRELSIFDVHDQRIIKASNTIQDFDDMEELIESRIRGKGALFRSRDVWGKWTERRL